MNFKNDFLIETAPLFHMQAMKTPPFDDFMGDERGQMLRILRNEAAYLYDAVKLYASSLKQALKNKEDPLNGTKLIQRLRNTTYTR